ncbi:MAG TPA: hypothetical protein VFS67_21540 [Polyangiaceae bacterium]|nr:hypothetical protein [Polyangiaceae bacterium]
MIAGSYRWGAAVLLAFLVSCRASQSEPHRNSEAQSPAQPQSPARPQLTAEPESFRFVVPLAYLPHELRGEGSERVLAPRDAKVLAGGAHGIRVEAGDDFALQIQFQPSLPSLPASVPGAQRVAAENDVAVFKSADGYWFVALRELVPEWDESERRRVACGSAGALDPVSPGGPRRFTHAAVERMVAACRSLELPSLE